MPVGERPSNRWNKNKIECFFPPTSSNHRRQHENKQKLTQSHYEECGKLISKRLHWNVMTTIDHDKGVWWARVLNWKILIIFLGFRCATLSVGMNERTERMNESTQAVCRRHDKHVTNTCAADKRIVSRTGFIGASCNPSCVPSSVFRECKQFSADDQTSSNTVYNCTRWFHAKFCDSRFGFDVIAHRIIRSSSSSSFIA